jgi:hypothetical protein
MPSPPPFSVKVLLPERGHGTVVHTQVLLEAETADKTVRSANSDESKDFNMIELVAKKLMEKRCGVGLAAARCAKGQFRSFPS